MKLDRTPLGAMTVTGPFTVTNIGWDQLVVRDERSVYTTLPIVERDATLLALKLFDAITIAEDGTLAVLPPKTAATPEPAARPGVSTCASRLVRER